MGNEPHLDSSPNVRFLPKTPYLRCRSAAEPHKLIRLCCNRFYLLLRIKTCIVPPRTQNALHPCRSVTTSITIRGHERMTRTSPCSSSTTCTCDLIGHNQIIDRQTPIFPAGLQEHLARSGHLRRLLHTSCFTPTLLETRSFICL